MRQYLVLEQGWVYVIKELLLHLAVPLKLSQSTQRGTRAQCPSPARLIPKCQLPLRQRFLQPGSPHNHVHIRPHQQWVSISKIHSSSIQRLTDCLSVPCSQLRPPGRQRSMKVYQWGRLTSGVTSPSLTFSCLPVCPTTEALSLWGILEDTFKVTRIW